MENVGEEDSYFIIPHCLAQEMTESPSYGSYTLLVMIAYLHAFDNLSFEMIFALLRGHGEHVDATKEILLDHTSCA